MNKKYFTGIFSLLFLSVFAAGDVIAWARQPAPSDQELMEPPLPAKTRIIIKKYEDGQCKAFQVAIPDGGEHEPPVIRRDVLAKSVSPNLVVTRDGKRIITSAQPKEGERKVLDLLTSGKPEDTTLLLKLGLPIPLSAKTQPMLLDDIEVQCKTMKTGQISPLRLEEGPQRLRYAERRGTRDST